jgi:sugar lactone lactonase YvrE
MLGGASIGVHAQTAHYAGAQSVIANAFDNGLNYPTAVAVDGSGNIYIADSGTNRVLKETLAAGSYTQTVVANATANGLDSPLGVAVDGSGNVYVVDWGNNQVLKETPSAGGYTQSVVADNANNGLESPTEVAVDSAGNVYIADTDNNQVLKETLSAGSYTQSVVAEGLNEPYGVAVDGAGNVYIADSGNSRILKETLSAGAYTQSVVASAATNGLTYPYGVTVDSAGNLYIADSNNDRVLKETLSAGSYTQSVIANAAINGLDYPWGTAVDGSGNIYIADSDNDRVLEETKSGGNFGTVNVGSTSLTFISMIFTFDTAGTLGSTAVVTQGATGLDFAPAGTLGCTAGTAYTAGETCVVDVNFTPGFVGTRYGATELLDGSGNVLATGYVQGTGVGPQVNFMPGTQSVIANAATNGLSGPDGIAVDGNGDVYIADFNNNRVLKETLSAGSYMQSVIANAVTNGLSHPSRVAVDGAGNVFIADTYNDRVLKETLSAGSYTQSVVANSATGDLASPEGVAVDGSGNVYIADYGNNRVLKETLLAGSYTRSVVANSATNGLNGPEGVAVDGNGNVYIADYGNQRVLMETPSAGSYIQSIVASAATNSLSHPGGVAVDGNGNVYIADYGNNRVLEEMLSAGSYIQSVVASAATHGLSHPGGVAVDAEGNVHIADWGNGRILKEDFADPPSLTFASTIYGTISTDSPKTVTLENVGNAALSFPIPTTGNNPSIAANFTLNSGDAAACPVENSGTATEATLAAGASCELAISFEPETTGTLTGSLVLTDNNLNSSAPGYASQSIALSGIATQATPTITWATPAAIIYGTALSATQLNATSPVDGNFGYTPASGTILNAGSHKLSVTLTPSDTTDYKPTTASVTLTVNQAPQTITFTPPTVEYYGVSPITLSATGGGSGNPVTFSIVSGPGSLSGTHNSKLTVTGTGTIVIAANQAGNSNYTAAPQVTGNIVVGQLAALIFPAPSSLLTGSTATFAWSAGTGVTEYALNLSTIAPGGYDLYASGQVTRNATSVAGLPTNGAKIYARLYCIIDGTTFYNDYIYATGSLAQLTSPAPSSLLTGASAVFKWSAGTGVSQYDLHLSAVAPGGYDLYVSGLITGTSTPVHGLPTNGATIYARLYSVIDGITFYNDYIYATGALAQLTSPAPSSLLPNGTVVFTWSAGTGVSQYDLHLSALAPGGYDLYVSGPITGTSTPVAGLPANGTKIYARLYSTIDGITFYNDYIYATGALAQLTSPAPGSLLTKSTEVFGWSAGNGVSQYDLHLSAVAPGGYDLYVSGHITGTSTPVYNLPTNGTKIYARLYSVIDGITFYNDYTYVTGASAQLISPAPGSLLANSTAVFTWSAGTGVSQYDLHLSAVAPGGYDLYVSGLITGTSTPVYNLPTNGTKIYARLYSVIDGVMFYNDYIYETGASAQLISPAPGLTLAATTLGSMTADVRHAILTTSSQFFPPPGRATWYICAAI